MNETPAPPAAPDKISRLVRQLSQTLQRLQELTGGELDAVLLNGGESYLLQDAQKRLRQSEAAQQELAARQASILDALPAHIALLDRKGVIVSVNEGWRNFAGVNGLAGPDSGLGQNYLEICERAQGECSGEAHAAAAGIRAVLEGDAKGEFLQEYPCHSPTELSWFLLRVNPIKTSGPGGAVVMHINITVRKLAEDSLRESEERFHGMFAAAATGIAISTPHGRYLRANAAYCRLVGYTEEELRTRDFASLTHPDDMAVNLKLRDELLTSLRENFTMEKRYVKKDGQIVWARASVSASHGVSGEIATLIVVTEDITAHKLAEDQLRWKTAFFEANVHSSQDGIIIVNAAGEKVLQNQRLIDLWQVPPEVAGDTSHRRRLDWAATQVRDPAGFAERVAHVYGHPDESSRDEIQLSNANWLDRSSNPVRGANGHYYGRIWTYRDITERKRTESRLRRLVDSNVQGVLFWNRNGQITGANDTFLSLIKHTRADLEAGRINWLALTPPEYAHLDRRCLAEIDARGFGAQYEKEFVLSDGTRVPILLGSAAFEDNRDEGVCFVVDLTERVKSEQALRMSKKHFKAIFEQAAVGVAQADAVTGRFFQVNQRYCEITDRRHEELALLTAGDITHPDYHERDKELERQARAGAIREFALEKRYLRKDGSEVWVNVTVSAMWAPGETPDYFLRIAQDITTRKKLEDAFRQAQKMEAMGTLAGGIAHDFNNILASINGYTELAQMTLTGNPDVREFLASVLQAGHRATALVRQILAFSRQEKLERAPLQLGPVMAESLELLRATIPATTEFVTSFATDAPTVLADANQIHQILMNLGTNAWHAVRENKGRIEMRLERCMVDAAMAASQPRLRPGWYARLSVSDTGCGMDAATLRRIFEPFFTTKPTGEGTGLGLAVVHGIMESHDGVVTVYSQPGAGTVFHLYFPAEAGEEIPAVVESPTVPRGQGERILVVDDEELLVQLGRRNLAALGYQVEATTRPAAALEMVRADPARFALVLTDQTMPKMTGLELAAQLLQIRPGLPILLTTGFSLSLTPERVRAAGIRQLLIKPASFQTLGTAIHEALHPEAGRHNP